MTSVGDVAADEGPIGAGRPCPICKCKADVAFRPFCSKRCADIDLNRWLTGSYVIPGGAPPPDGVDEDEF